MSFPFLQGHQLYLRSLCVDDSEGSYPTWFNNAEACRGNSHHVFPFTKEEALAYIRQSLTDRSSLTLAIVLREGDKHIGNIALQRIHQIYRSAELAIVLGAPEVWGKGHGKEAAKLIVDHGFFALNLHRIACGTFESNTAMRRLAAFLGMREEGRRREAVYKDGKYVDMIEYGVLSAEYASYWSQKVQV